jgi:hypothetical protein
MGSVRRVFLCGDRRLGVAACCGLGFCKPVRHVRELAQLLTCLQLCSDRNSAACIADTHKSLAAVSAALERCRGNGLLFCVHGGRRLVV